MEKKSTRILFTLIAVVGGILLILMLALAGDRSKGPVQNLLSQVSDAIQNMEDRMILQKRATRRAKNLQWLDHYINDIDKLRDPDIMLLGASDSYVKESFESIINLEDSLHTVFPLIHIYNAWGSETEQEFPDIQVQTILKLGSIPVITWEPWLSSFDEEEYPGIPKVEERDLGCLKAIADSTYDRYIEKWASEVAMIDAPVFIRLAHEMNDPYRYPWGPQNNKPADFVNFWHHVHGIFKKAGADNVLWVWSPHPSYGYFDAFYPGEDYVDYIGLGILNFGTVANWSQWWSFDDILERHYPKLDSFSKPMMVTEFGSLNVGGERSEWFEESFQNLPEKYPAIKSLIFFHYSEDKTVTNKVVSWKIINDPKTLLAIREQIQNWPDSLKTPSE